MELVVSAIICDREQGKLAVAQRRSTRFSEIDGKWEFPGGRVKVWETLEGALVREIKEETGFDIQPVELVNASINSYSFGDFVVLFYLCNKIGGNLKLSEAIRQLKWVSPHEALGLNSTLDGLVATVVRLLARRGVEGIGEVRRGYER